MQKVLIVMLFLVPALAWGKAKPEEYNISVHVQASELVPVCESVLNRPYCDRKQHLAVLILGKKYELNSQDNSDAVLRIGDYKARVIVSAPADTDAPAPVYEIHENNTYEFLFSDGKTRRYSVVGESE